MLFKIFKFSSFNRYFPKWFCKRSVWASVCPSVQSAKARRVLPPCTIKIRFLWCHSSTTSSTVEKVAKRREKNLNYIPDVVKSNIACERDWGGSEKANKNRYRLSFSSSYSLCEKVSSSLLNQCCKNVLSIIVLLFWL